MTDRSMKLMAIIGILQVALLAATAYPQTSAFSYQGQLNNAGTPANGNFEMEFRLFDAVTDGNQIGEVVAVGSLPAINGHYSTTLDFGADSFDDVSPRFLEISVRPAGNQGPFVVLSPRQPVRSTPFAIQARKAAVADVANNALQLGGIDASAYVTTNSAGNLFIRNGSSTQFNADFNISGQGLIGTSLTIANSPGAGYTLDVGGPSRILTGAGSIAFASPNAESGLTISPHSGNRADVRFNGSRLGLFAGTGTGVPVGGLSIDTAGTVSTTASLGVGTPSPLTRFSVSGGPLWTNAQWKASMNLENGAAIGWTPNASGQRYGIGQSSGGLYIFRTNSDFGNTATPANYSLAVTDAGNVVQARGNNGLVKAMLYVNANGTIIRCYNGIAHLTTGNCGFTVDRFQLGSYMITFGFDVSDRFVSVTPQWGQVNIGAMFTMVGSAVQVDTFITDVDRVNSHVDHPFMIIIY